MRYFRGFFLLRFDKPGGECCDLVLVQFGFISRSLCRSNRRVLRCFSGCTLSDGSFFRKLSRFTGICCLSLRSGIGQEPARQAARETAGTIAAAGSAYGETGGSARRNFFLCGTFLVRFVLDAGSRRGGGGRLVAILGQGLAGKNDFFFRSARSERSRGSRSIGTAIVVSPGPSIAIVIATRLATALGRGIF